jgi:hypothetical protein
MEVFRDPSKPSPHIYMWHYCGLNVTAARHGSFKFHFATANWSTDYSPSEKCIQCCPNGPTSFNGTGGSLCDCGAKDVIFHDPPLIFNMSSDPGENFPLGPSTMPNYYEEISNIKANLKLHYDTMAPAVDQMHSPAFPSLAPCCNGAWPTASCECNDYIPGHSFP